MTDHSVHSVGRPLKGFACPNTQKGARLRIPWLLFTVVILFSLEKITKLLETSHLCVLSYANEF